MGEHEEHGLKTLELKLTMMVDILKKYYRFTEMMIQANKKTSFDVIYTPNTILTLTFLAWWNKDSGNFIELAVEIQEKIPELMSEIKDDLKKIVPDHPIVLKSKELKKMYSFIVLNSNSFLKKNKDYRDELDLRFWNALYCVQRNLNRLQYIVFKIEQKICIDENK